MTTTAYVFLGAALLLLLALIVSYNRFVRQRNLVQESWRQVDVELRRRHDLVPNLVQTVQGYAAHERAVFEGVTQARAAAVAAEGGDVATQARVEATLAGRLKGLLAVAEAYPDLKASGPFQQLQEQLAETEDRIAAGRRFYNGNVRALNTRVEAFPSSITAALFGFRRASYFEVEDPAVRAPVAVSFPPPES
ncbi:MAG TPA: LemA family protein [Mycobacteriales bacterium]|nr:LemA family protein [Mycobacteriales bacterium]